MPTTPAAPDRFLLWTDAERADPRFGTFRSCTPSLAWFPAAQAAPGRRGAVVVCPGGGYGMKADYEGEPVARRLNEAGIHAFVLDYRVAPDPHPAPLSDVRRAIRTARALAPRLGFRPDRVGVLGFSAGGHLAACAAYLPDRVPGVDPAAAGPDPALAHPDAAVLCYPVVTMGPAGHAGSRTNLLGPCPDPALVDALSCERHVAAGAPPAFLWHTADDEAVPVANPLALAAALSAAHVPFELHVYPHGEHGLALRAADPPVSGWPALCADWLKALGF